MVSGGLANSSWLVCNTKMVLSAEEGGSISSVPEKGKVGYFCECCAH